MKKLFLYFKQIYRLALSKKKQENLVWMELKKCHQELNLRSGVFEIEKTIRTSFEIAEGIELDFSYMLFDDAYRCRVKILEHLDPELTTEMFVLASHFNNHLRNGSVIIHVGQDYVEYELTSHYLIMLLRPEEIWSEISTHYHTAKDVYRAYQRLVTEGEAPAIIFADILKENESEDDKQG